MNMQIISLLAVMSTNVILIVIAALISLIVSKRLREDTELKRQMFLFSLPINEDDNFLILDKIIQNEITVYTVYNFPQADDLYINQDDTEKMIKEVLTNTLKRLSPVYLTKLKYIYNEEVLEDIVFSKVRDGVLSYTVEINGTFRDKK